MEDLMACETRIQEHYAHVARVNTEGWKTVRSGSRPLAKVMARVLMALAVRMDRTVATQAMPIAVRTATTSP
jgi:hypothetical protein